MDYYNYQEEHPLLAYDDMIKSSRYTTLDKIQHIKPGGIFSSVVLINNIKEVVDAKYHDQIAYVEVEDLTGRQEVIFFPLTYSVYRNILKEGEIFCLTCSRDISEIYTNANECQNIKVIGLAIEHLDKKE